MFQFRDLINAHFSGWVGKADVIDDIRLPAWLDRRVNWNRRRDLEAMQRAERSFERSPVGKDATKDL